MTRVRTRFAPSPTGYLHVGGARTALFSWLYARKHGGKFILRIEDTDLERSTPEAVNAILEGITWLGLEYDEGPFYQTKRFDRYNEVIDQLLAQGLAYRCTCPKERLDALREGQMARNEKPRYDGHCRDRVIDADEPQVIRFRNPQGGEVVVDDLVRGRVVFSNDELDDLIIRRSDGSPTYNLSVVVDDMDMGISHVIRGDDHLNNTPRQMNILRALGVEPPRYAHLPMILGPDGQKLSKRHGAVSVTDWRDKGFLPEALLNYLVRLGWSHGDQEIFSIDEMIALFDAAAINQSASTFNTDKLLWLNQHYIKNDDPRRIARLLSPRLGELGIDPSQGPELAEVVKAHQERAKTLVEMAQMVAYCYQDFDRYDEDSAKKHLRPATAEITLTSTAPTVTIEPLRQVRARLEQLDDWTPASIHGAVEQVATTLGVKLGKVAQPLRVAVVGRAASPGIEVTLHLVGKAACLRRIDRALALIQSQTGRD